MDARTRASVNNRLDSSAGAHGTGAHRKGAWAAGLLLQLKHFAQGAGRKKTFSKQMPPNTCTVKLTSATWGILLRPVS